MATIVEDLRYAIRALRRSPAFALVAILSLALGIGAASALFSVVYGVLLRSLPFEEPDRLVRLYTVSASERRSDLNLSPANFTSLREESRAFTDLAIYGETEVTLTGSGDPQKLKASPVSAGFFEVLGVKPILGRPFRPEENERGNNNVAVLSHAAWQRHFHGSTQAVGATITLDGVARDVIGVMPEGFAFPEGTAVWIPREYSESFSAAATNGRGGGWLPTIGRLRPGTSRIDADSDVRTLGHRLASAFPATNTGVTFTVVPLHDQIVGEVRTPLLVLLGAVGLVLLIVCANVAGLLLARAATRRGEMAIRVALGASRGRLVRQLLTEAMVLATLGGGLGIVIAVFGTDALVAARPEGLPRLDDIKLDKPVLAFTTAMTIVAGLLVGLLPAIRASRGVLAGTLREGGGRLAGRGTSRLRDGLVVAELALAVILLAGAGLLVRSFLSLTNVDPGFRAEGAVYFEVELPSAAYTTDAAIRSFHDRLAEQLGGLPRAEAVGAVSRLPLAGRLNTSFQILGQPDAEPGQQQYIETRSSTPGYFGAIGIPLLRGRGIVEADREGSIPVAVISQSTVERHFGGADPIGQQIRVSTLEEPRTIVGIVGDVRHLGLDQQAAPHAYFPSAQVPRRAMNVVVRAEGDGEALAAAIRNEVRELDPLLPPPQVRPIGDIVGESVARSRFVTTLLGAFAAVALVLAAIGIFGLLSYTVAQRTREFGIRLALGARSADLLGMVMRRALVMAGIGLGAGLVGALLLTRFVRSVLYGVSPTDPITLMLVILVLIATVVVASLVPARRAAAVQPTEALRYE